MSARRIGICICSLLLGVVFCSTATAGIPWKFVAVGDSRGDFNGVNTPILAEIANEIVNQGADFVVFPGDLVNGGVAQTTMQSQLTTWRNTMQPVYNAGIDVYAVRGNHDLGSPAGVTAWNAVLPELPDNGPAGEQNLTYSVTHNNALVIGLDQYVASHRVNQTWLDAQLATNTQPHVFVFAHEPAFKVDHADCMDDYTANRDAFWASIENAGGRTYFTGHDHFYDHARVDGDGDPSNDIHQFVVGTAGAPLRDWTLPYNGSNSGMTVSQVYHAKQYGYLVGEIDGLNATLTWMERTGAGAYVAQESWSYKAIPEPVSVALFTVAGWLAFAIRRR